MKNELGDCTSRFNLCFLASTAGSGCSRSHSRAYAAYAGKQRTIGGIPSGWSTKRQTVQETKTYHSNRRCSKTDLGQHHRSRAETPHMGKLPPPSGSRTSMSVETAGAPQGTPTVTWTAAPAWTVKTYRHDEDELLAAPTTATGMERKRCGGNGGNGDAHTGGSRGRWGCGTRRGRRRWPSASMARLLVLEPACIAIRKLRSRSTG